MMFKEWEYLILCFSLGESSEDHIRKRGNLVSYKINYNLIDI